jgi:tetratricopeptide (TPR) repeat protein
VRRYRLARTPEESTAENDSVDVRVVAAEVEIAKSQENWMMLARIYNGIGDAEFRDKYINLALQQDPSPFYLWLFARMQGKVDQLPKDVAAGALEEVAEDWTTRGSILFESGNLTEAAQTYLAGIKQALDNGEWFLAAFYMRHALNEEVVDELFKRSLRQSAVEGNLWWQLRSFEELGWADAKRELL